jgi:hypothetical protein
MYKVDSWPLIYRPVFWRCGVWYSSFEFWYPAIRMLTCIPAVSCAWNISIYSISTNRFCGWRISELYTRIFGITVTLMYGQCQAVMSFQMHMFVQALFPCLTHKGVNVSQNGSFCTKWHPIIWYYTWVNKEKFTFEHSYNLDAHYCFATNTVHTLVYDTRWMKPLLT